MMSRKRFAISLFVASLLVPALASAATGYVSGRTNMRAGPDTGYPVVDTVRRGEGVVLHGCLRDWSWCDVGFRGNRGWMIGSRILGETVSGRVPVVANGSRLGINVLGFHLDEYWDTNYNGRFDNKRGNWQTYYRDHHRSSWDRDNDRDRDRDRGHRGDNRDNDRDRDHRRDRDRDRH